MKRFWISAAVLTGLCLALGQTTTLSADEKKEEPKTITTDSGLKYQDLKVGTGDEAGKGKGAGQIVNVPVAFGTSRKDYHAAFTKALEKAADACKPELVLVSAGFDAHALDPIGSLGLEVEDFVWLTRQVKDVAKAHAGGRLVSCLEGGYHLQALAESVHAHLEELLSP